MKKHKLVYRLRRYVGEGVKAKRETPYEIQLSSRIILDNLCFNWNKEQLQKRIDEAIDLGHEQLFMELSEQYKQYVWK